MNKKRSKQMIDTISKSNIIKIFITAVFGIVFLILLPLVILVVPFVFAWYIVDTVFEKQNKMDEFHLFQGPSKWGSFEVDFSSWKNNIEGEW